MGDIDLGFRLKSAREKAGLKQQEVCDKIGIPSVQTLSAYETGKNTPKLETIKQFCLLFGVSADSLLFGDDRLPLREKTKAEYAKQLVEAVDHLGLAVEYEEDARSYPYSCPYIYTAFDRTKYEDFNAFSHKWLRFRDLLDSGTIEWSDYRTFMVDRLNALEMKETEPKENQQKETNLSWDDVQFPF